MQKKFRCPAPETQAPVVRVKVKISKELEFFLVENAIFEPGAHEEVKPRSRSHGPHSFRHGTEWRDSNPSCRQHDIGWRVEDKSVAQGADEIQRVAFPAGEPFGSRPGKLKAKDSTLFPRRCTEGVSAGVPSCRTPDVVELAGSGMGILRKIERHRAIFLHPLVPWTKYSMHPQSASSFIIFALPCTLACVPCAFVNRRTHL
jgi:hypothetical protein